MQQLRRSASHRSALQGRITNQEVSTQRIAHASSGLAADKHPGRVIPNSVSVDTAIDKAIEHTRRDQTQIERRGSKCTKLTPSKMPWRQTAETHKRVGQIGAPRSRQLGVTAPRALAANRGIGLAACLVAHERHCSSVGIDEAERRSEPRHSVAGIGRAIERIDDDEIGAAANGESTLFRQHAEISLGKRREHNLISNQIGAVLTLTLTRRTPVGDGA